jgi:hypothetical protein
LPSLTQVVAPWKPLIGLHAGARILIQSLAQARLGSYFGVRLEMVEHLAASQIGIVCWVILKFKLYIEDCGTSWELILILYPVLGATLHSSSEVGLIGPNKTNEPVFWMTDASASIR